MRGGWWAKWRIGGILTCFGTSACAPHVTDSLEHSLRAFPEEAPLYDFQVSANFVADGPDVPDFVNALLSEPTYDLLLGIRMGRVRQFQDGSEGVLVAFESGQTNWTDQEQSGHTGTPGLVGRYVELRRFGDGQILRVSDLEHVFGGERHGEIFDLVFPILSPWIPSLKVGETDTHVQRWRLRTEDGDGWDEVLVAKWGLVGLEETKHGEAYHFKYEGDWSGEGSVGDQKMVVRSQGPALGEVWLTKSDLALVRHEFAWSRHLEVGWDDAFEGKALIQQTQSFKGSVEQRP